MFEKIRKPGRAKSIFAYIIFFLICFVFVFLGVPLDSTGVGGFAALVNKEPIPLIEFSKRLDQIQKSSQKQIDAESQKKDAQLAINQLINETLIFQEAQKSGLVVSDLEVSQMIKSFEFLHESNVFKTSLYLSFLENQRMSAKDFEDQIRRWVASSKLEQLFNYVFLMNDLESQKNKELNQFQIQLKYVRIALSNEGAGEIEKWQGLLSKPKGLERELRKQKLSWIDSQTVSIGSWNRALPIVLDEDDLFNQVVKKLPKKGVIPKLFVTQDGVVIASIKSFKMNPLNSFKEDASSKLSIDHLLSMSHSRMVFFSWLQNVKADSRIQINPNVL